MHFREAKSILSAQNGMNMYRGCSHGCIYCDSRSTCYNFSHDFEDIEVKINAPQLLEKALKSKRKKCMIGTGSMCDPYLHIESKLELTRSLLKIIDKYEFGVAVLTKSDRVLRDIDLLKSINEKSKAVVQMTLTTYDEDLCKILEPNVCTTKERFAALKQFQKEGIPTVVWLTPLLPYINDTVENIDGIIDYCIDAGVKGILYFGGGVTLRDGDREYFYRALDSHFPGLKEKYIKTFGNAYYCRSEREAELKKHFMKRCRANNIMANPDEIFAYLREYPDKYEQLTFE